MPAWLRQFSLSRWPVIAVPYLWLALFFLLPFLIVVKISLATIDDGVPPYTGLFAQGADGRTHLELHGENFTNLFADALYWKAYLGSLLNALATTALCLLLGYPMAYAIARAPLKARSFLLLLIILPFWTSFLIRIYAWIGILKQNGLINNLLLVMGIIRQPLTILNTEAAVILGMVYAYLPFMVLPLYAHLEKFDPRLLEAASDLGARPVRAFWTITLPLSLPGMIAGSLLVFIPAIGEYVIPTLLGGPDTLMIALILWNEFFLNRDWPTASAVTVIMVLGLLIPFSLFRLVGLGRPAKR